MKNSQLSDIILSAIETLMDGKLKNFKQTQTSIFPSVIYKVNTDGTYQIVKEKQNYNVKNGLGIELSIGQNVWVMIPNGSIRDMFVCGVR